MNDFDKRVETVLDALLRTANEYDIELTVESTFDDDEDTMDYFQKLADN